MSREATMNRSRWVVIGVASVFLGLPSCAGEARQNTQPSSEPAAERQESSIDGMTLKLSLPEYLQKAELVVLGTVQQRTQHTDDHPGMWKGTKYEDVTVKINEVLTGSETGEISVRRHLPSGTVRLSEDVYRGQFDVDHQYLMLLFRSDYWPNSYLVLGEQGVAEVNGDNVKFPAGPIDIAGDYNVSLEDVRAWTQ